MTTFEIILCVGFLIFIVLDIISKKRQKKFYDTKIKNVQTSFNNLYNAYREDKKAVKTYAQTTAKLKKKVDTIDKKIKDQEKQIKILLKQK